MEKQSDLQVNGDPPQRHNVPMWTGPFGDERAYRIDEPRKFRRGGLGVVFEAVICSDRHGPDLVGTRVGLKQLTGIDDYRWQRLEERSPSLAAVEHPNLSRHLGVFAGPRPRRDGAEADEDDPQRYIVHVWADGRPLADAVDAGVGTVLRWLRQIADGLDALHGHEAGPFAHRDLHPRNVIIGPEGDAVIIDFDTVFAGGTWTTTKTPLGSRFAAGPAVPVSPQAADRSALAKIAMHALASDGDGALEEKDVVEAVRRRLRVHGVRPEPALELLDGAMAGRGPATSTELIAELDAEIGGRRGGLRRVLAAVGITGRRRPDRQTGGRIPRHWWPRLAVAVVAVVAISVAAAILISTRDDGLLATSPLPVPDVSGTGPSTSVPDVSTTTTSVPDTMASPTGAAPLGTGAAGPQGGARSLGSSQSAVTGPVVERPPDTVPGGNSARSEPATVSAPLAPKSAFRISLGDTVEPGRPVGAGEIAVAGTRQTYTFAGTAGQILYLQTLYTGPAGRLGWRVIGPDGVQVAGADMRDDHDRIRLLASGDQTIEVGSISSGTGTYGFKVIAVPPDTTSAITVGSTVEGSIPVPGTRRFYTFAGSAGQTVYLKTLYSGPATTLGWRLLAPSGEAVVSADMRNDLGRLTLSAGGTHTIEVGGFGPGTGTFGFTITAAP